MCALNAARVGSSSRRASKPARSESGDDPVVCERGKGAETWIETGDSEGCSAAPGTNAMR